MRDKTGSDDLPGWWLMDAVGDVRQAQGIGTRAELRRQLEPHLLGLQQRGQKAGLFALDGPPACIVVVLRQADMQLAVCEAADREGILFEFVATVPFAYATLNHFLSSPHDAISVADAQGILRFISPTHERWLGLRRGEALGRLASEVIPHSRLVEVATSGKAEIGQPYSADGVATRIVSRIPVLEQGRVVGVIGRTLFKGPEVVQRMLREVSRLQDEVARYRRELSHLRQAPEPLARLVGDSEPLQKLKKEITLVAQLDVPVLILGESGTGKELVAKALHELSPRSARALVSLNLAALPASLIEAELFGYGPGTFTGSHKQGRIGKFETADRSTVFLDEVGDIPAETQVKLLRVLEDHVVERLGEHKPRHVDFRLIAATHRHFDELIESGQFRADLYYRLAGVTLQVPALCERLEDIPALLAHFTQQFSERNRRPMPQIETDVASYLAEQAWPGNVRQFRQRVEEALVFAAGATLGIRHFERQQRARGTVRAVADLQERTEVVPLRTLQRRAAAQAVVFFDGHKVRAAKALGISRSRLYRLLEDGDVH